MRRRERKWGKEEKNPEKRTSSFVLIITDKSKQYDSREITQTLFYAFRDNSNSSDKKKKEIPFPAWQSVLYRGTFLVDMTT